VNFLTLKHNDLIPLSSTHIDHTLANVSAILRDKKSI